MTTTRALILPDPGVAVWDDESAITQAGPRAGVPESSQVGSMVLGASGTQDAGTSVTIRTQQGGHPLRGGASYIWRRTGDTDAQWRGWDPPTSLSGWEAATWTDGSGTPEWTRYPDLAEVNGTLLCVVAYRDSSAPDEYGVRVYRRASGASQWVDVPVWGQAAAPTVPARSALMVLPSGRVHLYSIIEALGVRSVVLYYSDDDGATWAYGGDVLDFPLPPSPTFRSIRVCYSRGQALMVVNEQWASGDAIGRVTTYASDDMGVRFARVQSSYFGDITSGSPPYTGLYLDVVAGDAGIVLAGLVSDSTVPTDDIQATVLGDAYSPMPAFDQWIRINDTTRYFVAQAGVALATTDDGAMCLYWVDADAASPGSVIGRWSVSWDSGLTWTSPQDADYIESSWWDTTTPDYPAALTAHAYQGRMAVVGNWVATSGNEDDSVGIWWLGGYTSVVQAPLYRTTDWRTRGQWEHTWCPIELPGDMGWTAAGAGTQALATPGHVAVSCTPAQTRSYTRSPSATPDDGLQARVVVRPTDGGSVLSDRIAIRLRVADGAASYDISVRMDTAQVQVYDHVAAANVGSAAAIGSLSTLGGEILIGLAEGACQVWARTYARADSDRLYTLIASSTTLADGGAATSTITWGSLVTDAAGADSEWIEVHYASGGYIGAQQWATTSYPADLAGRDYGDGTYTDAGMSLIARDGPTWRGEEWVVAARYEYGITRALTVPSPRAGWRSTSTGAQVLAIRLDELGATQPESPYLGIVLRRSTLTRVLVETHDGSSWSSVGTAVLGWTGLGYTRTGRSVVPSGAAGIWLDYGEAAGASLALSSSVARRVTTHAEGRWDASYDLRPVLSLADVDPADPASGTATLTPDTVVLLVRIRSGIQGVRLTQAAPDASNPPPPDGYWQVGTVMVGWVRLLDDPDWGTSESTEADVEIDEARDRSIRTRVAGPTRRIRSVQWAVPSDLTEHRHGRPTGRLSIGAAPTAAAYGVPISIPAIIDRLSGGHTPIAYLPSLPSEIGELHILRRRHQILYGRASDVVTQTMVLGEEGVDEMATIGEMTITEEV